MQVTCALANLFMVRRRLLTECWSVAS
jgi:hypothetical protein